MKMFALSAVAVLSFAAAANATIASRDDSRSISTLPEGTKISTGQSFKILATLTSSPIGSSGCHFGFQPSADDRDASENILLTAKSGDNQDGISDTAIINAVTIDDNPFTIVCQKQDLHQIDSEGFKLYKPMTVGDFERALESVGGHMSLPPPQPFE